MSENKSLITNLKSLLHIYDTPDPTRVLGLDTSHWTGVVNWDMAKAAGIKFAIIKFMDGISPTKYAVENYKGAVAAGILVGGYTWLYKSSCISTGKQAREFLAMLRNYPCDIRPTVDFEWTSWNGSPSNPNYDDLYGFVIPFTAGYGSEPMIYTASGYWNDSARRGSVLPAFFLKCPLWKAQYRVSNPDPILPWGNTHRFWQFTANGKGSDYGYPGSGEKEADLNYWNGTLPELYEWCNKPMTVPEDPTIPDIPVPDPELPKDTVSITVKSLNIRTQPSTTTTSIGSLSFGNTVKVLEYLRVPDISQDDIWGRIDRGWIALFYKGICFSTKNDFSDVPKKITPPISIPLTGMYGFAQSCYYSRRGGGPLTLPLTRTRGKIGDNGLKLNWDEWKPLIEFINPDNPSAAGLIARDDWGPSQGLDNGFIKWLGLLWPGDNTVKIEEIIEGWGRVQGMISPSSPVIKMEVFDFNKSNGWGHRAKPVFVPIVGGPWWVEMKYLVKLKQ